MADPQTQTPERLPANFDFSKPITITAPDRLPADFDFEGASKKKETPTPPGFLDSYLDSIKGIFTGVAHDLRPKSRQEKVDAANHAVDVAAKYLHGNDTEKSAAKDEMISALPMGGTYLKVREGNYPGAAGDVAGLATVGLATHGIMNAPEIAGRVAESTPAAVLKAGVKAAAPDVAAGASKAAIGYGLSDVIPVGGIPGYALRAGTLYPGIRQMGKGVTKGVAAGRAALADRIAAGLEAAKAKAGPPPAVPGFDLFQGTTVEPPPGVPRPSPEPTPPSAGLLNRAPRTITPEAPPDTSYVRSVPAQYPEVQGPPPVQPKGLLGPGPERIITPPAPEDTSFVRSVPAEYPQGEGAPPAAPAAAAPAAIDPALLEGLAQANFKKPFAKLAAADQQTIRDTASAIGRKIPEETRGPLPKFREGSEALGEPQAAAQGKTAAEMLQEELAARKQAEAPAATALDNPANAYQYTTPEGIPVYKAPVSEQPSGRPVAEPNPVQETQGLTEEAESVPNLEPPRSQFLASGERKSQLLRAEEIKASNTTAKAKRYAEALHGFMTANQLQLMPKSRWPAVTNDLIIRGLLDKDEVPPNTSIPQIVSNLRELETAANKAKLTPTQSVQPSAGEVASTQQRGIPEGAPVEQTPTVESATPGTLGREALNRALEKKQAMGANKEPWEMTRSEYVRSRVGPDASAADTVDAIQAHRKTTGAAVREGKPVPPEVLADYADLAAEVNAEANKANVKIKFPLLPKTVEQYASDPSSLWSHIENLLTDKHGRTVGLRGVWAGELNKTPKPSILEGTPGGYNEKLPGTSTIHLTGDRVYDYPGPEQIKQALEKVSKYGNTDYIAVLAGDNAATDVMRMDPLENVIVKPKVVGYIRRKAPVSEQPSGRPAIESKPVQPSPGSTEKPGEAGKAILKRALEKKRKSNLDQ